MAQSLLQKADPRQEALRDLLDEGARPRRRGHPGRGANHRARRGLRPGRRTPAAGTPDAGPGHRDPRRPWAGVRAIAPGPVLLEFGGPGLDLGAWTDRVQHVSATYHGAWELPVVGEVTAPTAVLMRPNGHLAWVGEDSAEELIEALTTWCGTPSR